MNNNTAGPFTDEIPDAATATVPVRVNHGVG